MKKMNAVEMMRKIRDQISEETRDMSPAELRTYYQAASRRFHAKMEAEAARDAASQPKGSQRAVGA